MSNLDNEATIDIESDPGDILDISMSQEDLILGGGGAADKGKENPDLNPLGGNKGKVTPDPAALSKVLSKHLLATGDNIDSNGTPKTPNRVKRGAEKPLSDSSGEVKTRQNKKANTAVNQLNEEATPTSSNTVAAPLAPGQPSKNALKRKRQKQRKQQAKSSKEVQHDQQDNKVSEKAPKKDSALSQSKKGSFKDAALLALRIAIVHAQDPHQKFTHDQQEKLTEAITRAVLVAVQNGIVPKMHGVIREGGQFVVRCVDKMCFDWIKSLIGPNFRPWEKADLTATMPSEIMTLTSCRLWVPNRALEPQEAMVIIQGMNPELYTHRWRILPEKQVASAGFGMAVPILVDGDSLKVIQQKKGDLYYAAGKAYITHYPGWTWKWPKTETKTPVASTSKAAGEEGPK